MEYLELHFLFPLGLNVFADSSMFRILVWASNLGLGRWVKLSNAENAKKYWPSSTIWFGGAAFHAGLFFVFFSGSDEYPI